MQGIKTVEFKHTPGYPEIRAKAEEIAEKYCRMYRSDRGFWEEHVLRVRDFAVRLAEMEGADQEVVEIAALFHDAGKYLGKKDHHIRGVEIVGNFLESVSLPDAKKELILKCVLKHRTQYAAEDNELEVKVLQCADMLSRLFDENWLSEVEKEESSYILAYIHEKVMRKINLDSAKQIAAPQMERFKRILGV
jgi:putative nucleotidyltransferase with HDIG domain